MPTCCWRSKWWIDGPFSRECVLLSPETLLAGAVSVFFFSSCGDEPLAKQGKPRVYTSPSTTVYTSSCGLVSPFCCETRPPRRRRPARPPSVGRHPVFDCCICVASLKFLGRLLVFFVSSRCRTRGEAQGYQDPPAQHAHRARDDRLHRRHLQR